MSTTATKPAKKSAAKKQAPEKAPEAIIEDGTAIVFTELRTPVDGELNIEAGVVVFISSFNNDDQSYNISKTPNGVAVETLYREEFRLATSDEVAALETTTKAAKKSGKTAAEADNGKTKGKKDAAGKTVTTKTAKAPKLAKPAPEPLPPVKLYKSVSALVTESGGLIEAAISLVDRSGATDFTLGAILGKIQETGEFENLKDSDGNPLYGTGFVGFGKFVELHLGMKYRKATYLIGNYTKISGLGITEKQIHGIGWSKLVLVSSAITEANADELIAEAKAKPYAEFKAAVKKRLVDGGGNLHGNSKASMTTYTFRLHNDKAQVADEALSKAKAELGIEGNDISSNSQALDHILSDWMSMKG